VVELYSCSIRKQLAIPLFAVFFEAVVISWVSGYMVSNVLVGKYSIVPARGDIPHDINLLTHNFLKYSTFLWGL
jgi:hypothetical protein